MKPSASVRCSAAGLAFVLFASPCFAADPAPQPSRTDVEAWGRIFDMVVPAETVRGPALARGLALTGTTALREGKPALAEAVFRKVFVAAPELEAEGADTYFSAAWELSRDRERWTALAPFILLYLDVAAKKGSGGLASKADAVRTLRADLSALESPPPPREVPSIEALREVLAASERYVRKELARAKYRRTTADIRSMSTAFEMYAVDRSRYPAGDLDAVEKMLSPKYIRTFPRLDGWGTPFRVETSQDRKHYRIVSAGADGDFETLAALDPAATPVRKTVGDARRDIVFQDGDLVQDWSEEAFGSVVEPVTAPAEPRPDLATLEDRLAHRTTMADIRSIYAALESYNIDKGQYPSGWLETIEKLVVPAYIARLPKLDAWNTPYEITTSGKHVRIVSAGADGVFESLPYLELETRPSPRQMDDAARDIIFEDGVFVQQLRTVPTGGSPPVAKREGRPKARPAAPPTAADVASWGAPLGAVFAPETLKGPGETRKALSLLASEARRSRTPALAAAALKRVLGGTPEERRGAADAYFLDARVMYRDRARWSENAPFILLYLKEAERLRSEMLRDRKVVVALARANLLTVDAAPQAPLSPSVEVVRQFQKASESRQAIVNGRLAEYRQTQTGMLALGAALEKVLASEKRYPDGDLAAITSRLRRYVTGEVPRRDAWGKPLRYEVAGDGSAYRLVSAGSDGSFETLPPLLSALARIPVNSDDPTGDIVLGPGGWIREWSEVATYAPAVVPSSSAGDTAARFTHGRTLAEIRKVGDAIAGYRRDQEKFPAIGERLTVGAIPGVYISTVPTRDAWGTEYRVSWAADGKHFRIVSAGSDGVFEALGPVDPDAAWRTSSFVTDPKRDIVFQDGVFLQVYRDAE